MANAIKTYFLAPTWDYPPNGPIALGNIIAKPSNPAQPLNATDRLPIPINSLIEPTFKTDWEWVKDKLREGKIGIWARFLEALGIKVDVGVSYDGSNDETYAFDRMETSMFRPTDEYVKESMRAPGVVRFVQKSNYKKPVYMITGLRIVHGAQVKSLKSKGHSAQFSIGGDGTLTGVPASVGPEVNVSLKEKEGVSFGASSDFVFAFQLRRVHIERKTKAVEHEEYNTGAMLEAGAKKIEDADLPFEAVRLAERDAGGDEFGYEAVANTIDDDDEELCTCVMLGGK